MWRAVRPSAIRRLGWSIIGVGAVATLVATEQCLAQSLTVRPREVATATRTEQAGLFELTRNVDLVYVPQRCVGTRRCPLIVFLGDFGKSVVQWLGPSADKHGMIVLSVLNAWDATGAIDAGIKEVLGRFAIDPDKIAIFGRCGSGTAAISLGESNLDVFSRIGSFTPDLHGDVPVRPSNKTTEYFVSTATMEMGGGRGDGWGIHDFPAARELRQKGYPVKHVINFRLHEHQLEDYNSMGDWLYESWAIPDPAARPAPPVFKGPTPTLTTEAVAQMTAFWTRFMQEPDSIRTVARRAYVREIVVPIGNEQTSVPMVDMPALAAKHPSVAADLKAAGLTAQQHDTYRVALLSAKVVEIGMDGPDDKRISVEATSVLLKNAQFMRAHPDEFNALEATDMWRTP